MLNTTDTPRFADFVNTLETEHQAHIESLCARGHLCATIPVPGYPDQVLSVVISPARMGTVDERMYNAQTWAHAKDDRDRGEPTYLNDGNPMDLAELDSELSSEISWAAFFERAPVIERAPRFIR